MVIVQIEEQTRLVQRNAVGRTRVSHEVLVQRASLKRSRGPFKLISSLSHHSLIHHHFSRHPPSVVLALDRIESHLINHTAMSKKAELQPLQELLDSIQSRLDVLESKIGVATSPSKNKAAATPSPSPVSPVVPPPPPLTPDAPPAVKAYDVFLETSVAPLADACNALQGMQHMGQLLQDAWTSIRTIIIIASKAKKPENVPTELQPHLTETQTALEAIRKLRLDRQYDDHCKAILESCAALSWILISPTPVALVKEASSSTEFWSNRIRKTHKGSNDQQIAFCNALQTLLRDLISYITEYHKTGLEWNPRGVSLAEAAIVVSSSSYADTATMDVPLSPRPFVAKVSGGSGGISSLVAELESKRTADGSSAATGLKHVRILILVVFFYVRRKFVYICWVLGLSCDNNNNYYYYNMMY